MAYSWLLAKVRYPDMKVVRGMDLKVWRDFADWLVGPEVWGDGLRLHGSIVSTPTLELVLDYEYELRRKACMLVNHDDKSFVEALKEAQGDSELKRRHFTAPAMMMMSTAEARARVLCPAGSAGPRSARGRVAFSATDRRSPGGRGVAGERRGRLSSLRQGRGDGGGAQKAQAV